MRHSSADCLVRAAAMVISRDSERWAEYRDAILCAWADGQAVVEMQIQQPNGRFLSVNTVQNYVQEIYAELGVKTAPAAVAEGIRLGYLACCGKNCHGRTLRSPVTSSDRAR